MTKIEIDLNDLGLYSDEDPEQPGSVRQLVIQEAARRLVSEAEKNAVRDWFRAEAHRRITTLVSEVLEGPIEESTRWGEPKRTTSVREIIRETLETYLTAPGRSRESFPGRDPKNMKELIQDYTHSVLNAELRKEIDKAKAAVSQTVTQAALKEAVKIIEAKGGK